MTLPMAEPAGNPYEATVDDCKGCGGRLIRLHLPNGQWRHDNGSVTCPARPGPLPEPTFPEIVQGSRPR